MKNEELNFDFVEDCFNSGEKGIIRLLEKCKPIFTELDFYRDKLRNHDFQFIDEYNEAINKLAGYYGFLNLVLEYAQGEKEIQEDLAYYKEEQEVVKNDGKVVSAVIERHAHKEVGYLIRIRNIVRSYVTFANLVIFRCENQRNSLQQHKPQE